MGQYYALQDSFSTADRYFEAALEAFNHPAVSDENPAADCQQTQIYRAFNALEGNLDSLLDSVYALFGNQFDEQLGAKWAANTQTADQYLHHLLLRLMAQNENFLALRKGYVDAHAQWGGDYPQHPWSSIWGHRALLLQERSEIQPDLAPKVEECLQKVITIAEHPDHGPTMALIGATWATVAACLRSEGPYEAKALELIEKSRALPGGSFEIENLLCILKVPLPDRVWEALGTLRFNYC